MSCWSKWRLVVALLAVALLAVAPDACAAAEAPADSKTETAASPAAPSAGDSAPPAEPLPLRPIRKPDADDEADDDGGDLVAKPILEVDPQNPYRAREPEEKKEEAPLVREGKRLLDRQGTLLREGGDTLLVFATGDKPMALLPCRPLELAENLSQFGHKKLAFGFSGIVYEYRQKNYLLMTDNPQATMGDESEAAPPKPPVEKPKAEVESKPAEPKAADPASEEPPKAHDLAVPPEGGTVTPATAEGDGQSPGEVGPPQLLPEDKRLIDREGRITRSGNQTLFIFDTGDTPIVLLPNKKLERMEDLAEYGRKPMHFRISGRVTEYRGRNYLSMSKMVIIPKEIEKL